MPITKAGYRHLSPFPASAQLRKTKQAVIVRVQCFKRRAMAQACLVAQDTLTSASKLRGLPSPVIIHVLTDEKPPDSSPSPVIIHVLIDEKPPNSRPYPVIIHVHKTKTHPARPSHVIIHRPKTIKLPRPSPVIIHVLIDEKPSSCRPCPVIIHVLRRKTTELSSLSFYHPPVPSPGSSEQVP
jgi:hypothetical protein